MGGGDKPQQRAHARTCIVDIRESLGFPQIQWGQPLCWNYHVYHVHVCVCMCMCTCVGDTPQPPPPFPPSPPTPRATGSPKHQNSISLELIEIIQFCLKLPLNIPELYSYSSPRTPPTHLPHPQSQGNPNRKNYIS